MFCKMCGQQLEDTATVCSNCGHETGVVAATKVEETVFCKKCGRNIGADKAFCPYCGTPRAAAESSQQQAAPQQAAPQSAPVTVNVTNNAPAANGDAPSTGFAVLGFFFPLIGLILWLVWKDQTPLKAKSCGKGALIGVIVNVVSSVLIYVFYFVFVLAAMEGLALPLMLL